MVRLRFLLSIAAVVLAPAAHAQTGYGDPEMHAAAAVLRAGQFAWSDDQPADGAVSVVVSLTLQRVYVYRGDRLVGVATVSTGRRGKRTPAGDFAILQKARWHRSNLYSNAPMPFMQRLTWDGIALHAGQNPGYPASHGCVRLPAMFARDLFELTSLGSPVVVADYPLQSPVYLQVAGYEPTAPMLAYAADLSRL